MRSSEWSISFLRQLFSLTSRYWRSEEKKSAYAYLLGIVTLTIAAVYMTLLLNDWFNEFYSALQNYDADAVYHGLIRFTGLAFAHIKAVFFTYCGDETTTYYKTEPRKKALLDDFRRAFAYINRAFLRGIRLFDDVLKNSF